MSDERNVHGKLRPDVMVKDDWVLKAYSQFPADVINVSSHDLLGLTSTLAIRASQGKPVREAMVSANTVDDRHGLAGLRPFITRTVAARQNGAKPLRVAFIGLTETTPAPQSGFRFIDPIDAAKRTLPGAKKGADLVIAVAKVKGDDAARIAREVPGIDVIIAGNAQSADESFTPPIYVGPTLIVFTPFETRMLGELRVYRNADGKFTTKQRFISIDAIIPDDPSAKQLVTDATKAEVEAYDKSKSMLENWFASAVRDAAKPESTRPMVSPAFATSAACAQCHRAQYMKWSGSAHAHTIDRLQLRASEFEASCLDCHATGSRRTSEIEKGELTAFQNVQCEACHGPGSDHVAKPGKGYGRVTSMQTTCARCHTSQTSPVFDLQTAWAVIKH